MPWWFLIITHLWVICTTLIVVWQLENDGFEGEPWGWKLFLGFICLLGPIAVIFGICGAIWEEKEVWSKIEDKWLFRKLKQFGKWFKERGARKKDFKECEDNEDEWRIERMGIK